jgi:hypothetical protein
MDIEQKQQLIDMISIQAEMKEQVMSDAVLKYLVTELQPYGFEPVMQALRKLGKESTYKINLAEVIKRIDDGRPSAQTAWAQCPKNEEDSALLTEEQNKALCSVSHLMYCGDPIPARMAFLEKYNELIEESRASAKPVKYVLGAGSYKQGRIDAVKIGVEEGKLLRSRACWMLQYTIDDEIMLLESPLEPLHQLEHQEQVSGITSTGLMPKMKELANSMRMQ